MAVLSLASLASGTALSCFADRLPLETARGELFGGLLFAFGLAVIGAGLSPYLH